MKININQIPLEGLIIEEEINPAALDLETEIVKLPESVKVRAEVSRITNAISVKMAIEAELQMSCSRCLGEFAVKLNKSLQLGYSADRVGPVIDLGPDIRAEIILDYPIKPLCKLSCKGLCPKCGRNLNEGGCNCATT
ncbi:MAG: DUF177 domain-containing protein [Candidatus Omnitrophota bacterium]|jgi:uncharacterized protein